MSDAVEKSGAGLHRHFGLLHATALNVTMVVGAGVFLMVPLILKELPGPYALLAWLGAGALILVDSLIWSELGASFPGSGGSYLYLLECYGRNRWGRAMAFLFIWQFLISGPLEIASGLIAIALFSNGLSTGWQKLNDDWTWTLPLWGKEELAISIGPARIGVILIGVVILFLLYRRITSLGRLTVTFWVGVLAVIAWILAEGLVHSDLSGATDYGGRAASPPEDFARHLGMAMILAMYCYLGYYNICYIGDEVRDPARTIPRAIILSALLVVVLFLGLHLAMVGTVGWANVPTEKPEVDTFSLPAELMRRIHGDWAAALVSVLLIWSCIGSAFAGLLGYSRIPYGAARYGHFFAGLGKIHPVHHIPHVSLLLVGGLTLFWSLFDLTNVINALIVTRILEQFVGQIVGLLLLRRYHPEKARPFKMVLYPLPCFLALAGWLFLYCSAPGFYIVLGLVTLVAGVGAFVLWSRSTGGWPFSKPPSPG
jgi:amino acid transporter